MLTCTECAPAGKRPIRGAQNKTWGVGSHSPNDAQLACFCASLTDGGARNKGPQTEGLEQQTLILSLIHMLKL